MTEIRAFVGHSFGPNDEIVVQTFLKYFDQVSGILPSFTWSSAKASEPTELGKKVMSLTADRNAFIGICTKKERVVCDEKLYQPFYSRQLLQGQSTDYAWKTSDWVIQEIGLAVGRGLPIIILLEKGCRKPGGIQGDVEFISFDREAPLQACGQLLEMIRSLSPPIRSQETASTEGPAESLVPSEAVVEPEKDEMPDDTWDQKKFENAFVWQMLIKEDAEKAEKIDNAFLDSDYANDAVKKSEWLAMREYWRIRSPTGGSLNAIKKLHNDYPNNADITSTLADALSYFGRNLEAAQKNMLAAELENVDVSRSQDHKRVAAIRFAREKEFEISHSILNQQKYNILRTLIRN